MHVSHIPPNCPDACCGDVHSYTQCRLVKKISEGECNQIAWIPTEFAVVGKIIKIRSSGVWDNGWEVMSLGATKNGQDKNHSVLCEH